VTGIDYLVKVTLVEDQYKDLLNHVYIQGQLRYSNRNHKPVMQKCCLTIFRLGEYLVSLGSGFKKRFEKITDATV
jgi:hypothetical protein